MRNATVSQMSLPNMIARALNSLASFGGALVLVVIYAGFLLGEWTRIPDKLRRAFLAEGQAGRIMEIGIEINRKVGDYLAVKTAINVVLGLLSFGVLWAFDVDFAVFWAVVIGLLNYIPYVGSLIAVMLPVLLSIAQFGQLWTTLALGAALTGMQMFVGNYLEPRWIGRQMNLSPVAVILALATWSALWGVPGAILAVPLTSVLVIVFAEFPGTRPLAVLVSDIRTGDTG
jgi:predicted PurR-regulated permease PerM